jgi:uncharacterized sulfatase
VTQWTEGKRGKYLAVLEAMDRQLGRLFDYLREVPELRDNTLLLLCSDNGPEAGAGSAGPLKGGKTMLYEGGTRSPLIVWAPGLLEKSAMGKVDRASVFAAFDLAPSLLSIAGLKAEGVAFDGEDVSPALLGRAEVSRGAPIFWRRPPDRKTAGAGQPERLPDLAMREGEWKLLCEYDGSQPQLYHLKNDPGESRNLAAVEEARTRQMTAALLAWHGTMPPDRGEELGRLPAAGKKAGGR